jgi:hypothetical protein
LSNTFTVQGFDEEDDKGGDDDDDEAEDMKWGKKKNFYGADVSLNNKMKFKINMEEQDALQEEEQEALRIQKKKLAGMSAQDFDDEIPTANQSFESRLQKPEKVRHL